MEEHITSLLDKFEGEFFSELSEHKETARKALEEQMHSFDIECYRLASDLNKEFTGEIIEIVRIANTQPWLRKPPTLEAMAWHKIITRLAGGSGICVHTWGRRVEYPIYPSHTFHGRFVAPENKDIRGWPAVLGYVMQCKGVMRQSEREMEQTRKRFNEIRYYLEEVSPLLQRELLDSGGGDIGSIGGDGKRRRAEDTLSTSDE